MAANRRLPMLLVVAALAAITLAVFSPTLGHEFLNYDDDLYIVDSKPVGAGLSRDGVAWAFTSFHGANWFPLTRLSWMLDAQLFGLDPRAFHATSMLLHAASAMLLLVALRRMTGAFAPSAFVAAVFALHPLHVESVAWAAARKDVLSGFFLMWMLLIYPSWARAESKRARVRLGVAVFLLLALGLLAKPTLVTAPFLLLLLDAWPLGRLRGADGRWDAVRIRRAVVEKLPLFGLVAAICVVTVLAQQSWGTVQSLEIYPFGVRVGNALVALFSYLGRIFWPAGLAVFYPHPGDTLAGWKIAASAVALVAVSAAALRALPHRPHLGVGWFSYLGTLVPVIGLVQVGQAAMADRYTYIPLIGIAWALAWSVGEACRSRAWLRPVAAAGACALVGALAATTFVQVGHWRDSRSLFEHALRVTERNHVAHINLGHVFEQEGSLDEASSHLTTALRYAPNSATAHGLLGDVRVRQGRASEALPHYRSARRREPDSAHWVGGLGAAQIELAQFEEAEASLREAVSIRPDAPRLHANLGRAVAGRGRHDEAIEHFERALSLDPGLDLVHAYLAATLAQRGELAAALDHIDRALRALPESPELHVLRARLVHRLGRQSEAVAGYREALRLGHRPAAVLNDLAWIQATSPDPALRDPARAVELAAEAAEQTRRRDPAVLDTLAASYAAAGRRDDAARTARLALELAEAQGNEDLAAAIRARLQRWTASGAGGS